MNKGHITISRVVSNQEEDFISIEIEDSISGIPFAKIEMDTKSFGFAITGRSYMDCLFELRGIHNIGLTRETKHIEIPVKERKSQYKDEELLKIFSEYEIDGWKGSLYDIKNNNNWKRSSDDSYNVLICFSRYVKAKDEKDNS